MAVAALVAASLGCGGADSGPPHAAAAAEPVVALEGGVTRLDLRFPCADSICAAWLYRPPGIERPPVVVMAHGFAGTRDVGLPYFAERFAHAGLAAFVFDYRGFGASGGSPRQLVDPARQLEDWRAAIAAVRDAGDLDGQRVAVWGSSLGAGHALVTAADDPALRAVVAQAPLIDTSLEGEASFYGVAWAARIVVTGWLDLARTALGGEPLLIPAIAPAGGFGMIVDDDAYAAFERLVAPGSSYRNAVVAHSAFTFDDYDPSRRTGSIRAPVLLIASRSDRFAPFAAVEACAAERPGVALVEIPGDHFDVYSPPVAGRAAEAAVAFLRDALAPALDSRAAGASATKAR